MSGWSDRVRGDDVVVAPEAVIAPSARIAGHRVRIDPGVTVGDGVALRAGSIHLGRGTRIGAHTEILMIDRFEIGALGWIDRDCVFRGRSTVIGDHLFMGDRVLVGGGGAMGPNAELTIGDGVTIISETYLNLAEPISIGSHTALSARVAVLTHGCWQPVLDGYPSSFAPVRVGEDVVIYYASTILPGCHIGDGTAIGANSVLSRPVGSHCLAAGNPAKVIHEGFPRPRTPAGRKDVVLQILSMYAEGLSYKGISEIVDEVATSGTLAFCHEGQRYRIRVGAGTPARGVIDIELRLPGETAAEPPGAEAATVFELGPRELRGHRDLVVEDLRDHLRRTGVRILDEHPFRTIPPAGLASLPALP